MHASQPRRHLAQKQQASSCHRSNQNQTLINRNRQLVTLADEQEAAQVGTRAAAQALAAGAQLLAQLAALKFGLREEEAAVVRQVMCPTVEADANTEVCICVNWRCMLC
jgi:hypothetical protein